MVRQPVVPGSAVDGVVTTGLCCALALPSGMHACIHACPRRHACMYLAAAESMPQEACMGSAAAACTALSSRTAQLCPPAPHLSELAVYRPGCAAGRVQSWLALHHPLEAAAQVGGGGQRCGRSWCCWLAWQIRQHMVMLGTRSCSACRHQTSSASQHPAGASSTAPPQPAPPAEHCCPPRHCEVYDADAPVDVGVLHLGHAVLVGLADQVVLDAPKAAGRSSRGQGGVSLDGGVWWCAVAVVLPGCG